MGYTVAFFVMTKLSDNALKIIIVTYVTDKGEGRKTV